MKTLKTLLFNVKKNTMTEVEIEDKLQLFYSALGVDIIELPMRSIGGKVFTIMCDEEGLLKDGARVSCISRSNIDDIIAGNVMFFNDDGCGDLESLTDDDIDLIRSNVGLAQDNSGIHRVVIMD